MVVINEPQTIHQVIAPYLTLFTPAALLVFIWRFRGWVDAKEKAFVELINNLTTNHLAHAKQDIIDAVNDGIKVETTQHQGIIDAVREANAETAQEVRASGDKIVGALIALKR